MWKAIKQLLAHSSWHLSVLRSGSNLDNVESRVHTYVKHGRLTWGKAYFRALGDCLLRAILYSKEGGVNAKMDSPISTAESALHSRRAAAPSLSVLAFPAVTVASWLGERPLANAGRSLASPSIVVCGRGGSSAVMTVVAGLPG